MIRRVARLQGIGYTFLFLLGTLAWTSWANGQSLGPAESFFEAQLRAVDALETQLGRVAEIADRGADRLRRGGRIYLCGEKGIVAELLGRAGGLCGAKALSLEKPVALTPNDVVLLSDYGTPGRLEAALAKLTPSKALVIVFASDKQPLLGSAGKADVCTLGVDIPLEHRLLRAGDGSRRIPMASPAISAAEWTYVAELLAACRRHGSQLAIYLSLNLDPGRRRFERTKNLLFEPDVRPQPVPPAQYGRTFLNRLRASLTAIRDHQMGQIRQAAAWLREAKLAGRRIVRNMHGHLPPIEAGTAGDVDFFTDTVRGLGPKGVEWIRKNLHQGDVYFLVGYQQNEDAMAMAATQQGARTVFLTSTPPGLEESHDSRHLYIDPHWPVSDGCLDLVGYDVKACPLSAILNMSCYWATCAEVVAIPTSGQ